MHAFAQQDSILVTDQFIATRLRADVHLLTSGARRTDGGSMPTAAYRTLFWFLSCFRGTAVWGVNYAGGVPP